MIHLVYGKKGTGKSKKLINMANAEMEKTHGNIVYIDDSKRYMYDLKYQIRFINMSDYNIDSADMLYGFICGILSRDFDITSIYVDGLKRMVNYKSENLQTLLTRLDTVFDDINAYIVLSGDDDIPEYLKKYIK